MSTLFDTDNRTAGFHLKYLEIYNWGTFHDQIYRLNPDGRNSLLTGANGSGKTTVVDALISLLVPPARRHYNQSSGADKKKERDELSYFLGAYGNLRDEENLGSSTQYLRTKDGYSVLLACFFNESYQQPVTLAQVRWFSAGNFKRLYLLSTSQMEVEKDFIPFDGGSVWRKHLAAHHPVKFFDSFNLYAQSFSALFGLRSEKALTLFGHVVGVKVLGDLNEFIRENMLDAPSLEDDFQNLRKNYEDLLGAHRQIEKARLQLQLLEPVHEKAGTWVDLKARKENSDAAALVVAPVFAWHTLELLQSARDQEEVRLISADNRKLDLDAQLDGLRRKERDLEFALRGQDTQVILDRVDREALHKKEIFEAKKQRAMDYDNLAQGLGFPTLEEEAGFWQVREEAAAQIRQAEEALPLLSNTWADQRRDLQEIEDRQRDLESEILSLENRESLIPGSLVELRDRMAAENGLKTADLPFFGEYLRVEDPQWQGAIEYLFRELAQSVLVHQDQEAPLRTWLENQTPSIPMRLFILKDEGDDHFFTTGGKDLVLEKCVLRPSAPPALERYLKRHYDILCVENDTDFHRASRALKADGLFKDGKVILKPEGGWDDPLSFQLGWENLGRLRLMKGRLKDLLQKKETLLTRLSAAEEERRVLDLRRVTLEKLLSYQSFADLAWQREKAEWEALEAQKKDLTGGSGDMDVLQNELAEIRTKIKEKNKEKDELIAQTSRIKGKLEDYNRWEKENLRLTSHEDPQSLEQAKNILDPYIKNSRILLDLENIREAQETITQAVLTDRKNLTEALKSLEKELETALHRYVSPGTENLTKYPEWSGEVTNLMARVDYMEDFLKIYDRVLKEDLPGHQKRFKDWLSQRLVEDMADFKTSLETHQRAILESVKELNTSLKTITYNTLPPTYVQLEVQDSRDVQIRDFKKLLREALMIDTEGDLEKTFHRIRALIQALSENEDWRRKVTDVRNWLQFSAMELYTADETQKQYYQDSQSLSGGEKAKLAYTILASAIAYQFGIRREGVASRSFRFAVVDEAFSKVDPENSKFAMNLFAQLDLQLMVVTPLDKINVVEDHIHTIHYVENKKRKSSSVFDLSIKEVQALRQKG